MPTLKVEVPHKLAKEDATLRTRKWLDHLADEHGSAVTDLNVTWSKSSAKFAASTAAGSVSGSVTVRPSAVNVQMKLPLLAVTFKPQIKALLVRSLTRELTP